MIGSILVALFRVQLAAVSLLVLVTAPLEPQSGYVMRGAQRSTADR